MVEQYDGQMYIDEPSMKTSLLHARIHFTLSQHNDEVDALTSPKLAAFFQTLYALNPSISCLFSKESRGYNEQTLQCMASRYSPEQQIINCEDEVIKSRTKIWIDQI